MFGQFNGILLDVIVILMILLPIIFGFIKGFTHTGINILLLYISILISVLPEMNFLREFISNKLLSLFNLETLGIERDLMYLLNYGLLSTLIIFIFIYVILRVVKFILFKYLINKENNNEKTEKGIYMRIAGTLIALVFQSTIIIAFFGIVNNGITGLSLTTRDTYVTKHLIDFEEEVVGKIANKDGKEVNEEIFIRITMNDLFLSLKGQEELVGAFKEYADINKNAVLIPENLERVQENVNNLNNFVVMIEKVAITDTYKDFKDKAKKTVVEAINKYSELANGGQININNMEKLIENLSNAGFDNEIIELVSNTFINV